MVKEFASAELWKAVAETKQVDKAIAGLAKSLNTDLKAYGFKQAGDTIVGYIKVPKGQEKKAEMMSDDGIFTKGYTGKPPPHWANVNGSRDRKTWRTKITKEQQPRRPDPKDFS